MSKGKRYDNENKLNIQKVIAVVIAIAVILMFIVIIKELLLTTKENKKISVTSYYPVYTNEKWGVIDSNGNIVIEPTMSEIITIPDNKKDLFICTYDINYEDNTYKTKVLNSKQKELFTKYETVEAIENHDKANTIWYEENVLKVKKDGKYGLINNSGKEILAVEYEEIKAMEGIKNSIIIKKDNKLGLCDNQANIIISQEYKDITGIQEDYKNGYIVVNDENKYGLISFDKKTILEAKYENISAVTGNGMYVVKENGTLKVINKEQEILVENKFDDVKEINENDIIFIKNKKYGVINSNSEEKIKAQYEDLKYAFSDYYIAKKSGKYGIINTLNEVVLPFEYISIIYRKQADFIEVETGEDTNTHILNNKFERKLTGLISEVNIEKGYMRIRVEDEYKYYNFKFEEKLSKEILNTNNLFLSKKDGKYGYIDKDQNVVVDYIYEDAVEQNQFGYVSVKKDGKWGALDSTAKQVAENKYELNNNLIIDFIGKWHIGEDININYYTDKNS